MGEGFQWSEIKIRESTNQESILKEKELHILKTFIFYTQIQIITN